MLLIHFPIRGRKRKFFDTLDKYYELSTLKDTRFNIVIDNDDEELNNPETIKQLSCYYNLKINFADNTGKVQAINSCIPEDDWNILIVAADDLIPQEKGYDEIISKSMEIFYPDTDGILHFYDGHRMDLNTMPIIGRRYYERLKYVYNPDYISVWCDNEFQDVATILKKQTFIDRMLIDHQHPIWLGKEMDELGKKNESFFLQDKETYERRKAINFGL